MTLANDNASHDSSGMRGVDFVMYTSKLCNLRCRYCYELPLLADKRRMAVDSVESAFRNIESFLRTVDEQTVVRFCWHGGEPLLIKPEYYWEVFERQRAVFGGTRHIVVNSVQSNLTVLDDSRIDLIKNGFDHIGVSLDLFTGLRVNLNGACQEHRTKKNLERLLDMGIDVGGITVLSRKNIDRIADIYGFYRDRGMSFRLLPFEPGLQGENTGLEISAKEILSALCEAADLWFTEAPSLRIEPIHSTMGAILAAARKNAPLREVYDLSRWLWVVRVDTNGEILGYNDGFETNNSSGNLFTMPFEQIVFGEPQQAKAKAAAAQIETSCSSCPHYRTRCEGFHVVDGAPCNHETNDDGGLRCVVARGLFDHIVMRLTQAGVLDPIGRLTPAYLSASTDQDALLPHPAVA